MKNKGTNELEKAMKVIKNMTATEYETLFEQSKHARGFNGEPSHQEQLERGFFNDPIERHGIFINAVYRHYKGNYYVVTDIVNDCETTELVVIYEALYKNEVSQKWCRKLSSFADELPDGTQRFALSRLQRVFLEEDVKEKINMKTWACADRLIQDLLRLAIAPKAIAKMENGLCFTFASGDKKMYLELYNDGDIGYIVEDCIAKKATENEDILIDDVLPRIKSFLKYEENNNALL